MLKTIALLTDFGLEDIYVGVMKAVISDTCPGVQIVDITHAIQPQNVREAAFALLNSYRYFGAGTVFCAVVDPGVGSARLPIAVANERYTFVAPDNGILSYALANLETDNRAVKLENSAYFAERISRTFHGRDIFAHAAAHLAKTPSVLADLGDAVTSIVTFATPQMSYARHRLIGEVMHIDHFGNIITSIGAFNWEDDDTLRLSPMWGEEIPPLQLSANHAHVTIHSHTAHHISHAYHEVPLGAILAQIDSNGFLEISANQDDAAARLDVQIGDKVMLRLTD
ncbi:MAG: SAM-dependent chlorinase/fluorinase [Chloroflexi bacterium]|nr:SAM-dependent chlorinase/fluorinase [Chloroflexota bacterium]